jgi:regulator of ribonuclease activity A
MSTPVFFESTPDLLDEFDAQYKLQVLDPSLQFKHYGYNKRFGGEIVTVKCYEDNSLVKEQLALDGCGRILVVDGGGSLRCALLGDLIAAKAVEKGWLAVVIYGCVRDSLILKEMNLGVLALNCHPRKSVRQGRGDLNILISFGGVVFNSGNFLYADENGVIVSEKPLV